MSMESYNLASKTGHHADSSLSFKLSSSLVPNIEKRTYLGCQLKI